MTIRTKKHRLPESAYHGAVAVAFTACEANRKAAFTTTEIVEPLLAELAEACRIYLCVAPVYCFMPDHLHVILVGQTPDARPKKAIERFKHQTGAWLRANRPHLAWQDDFYDHIIRKSEDWSAQIQHIAGNPVRAGLVEDMFDFPFTGSIGGDWQQELQFGL